MGCKCENGEEKTDDELKSSQKNDLNNSIKAEINQNIVKRPNYNNNFYNRPYINNDLCPIDPKSKPKDEFSRYLFNLINSLRLNPPSYIDIILKAKNNVSHESSGEIIYKSSVKVAINTGEKAFDEAVEILKNTPPMDKLIYNPNLTIDLPTNENDVKSRSYLSGQIRKKIDLGVEIKSFWKDAVKDPDTCFILTVVDDSGKHAGNKRNDILNRNNRYIGISSIKIGRSFACYIVIS
jgi:hypothetical protein